MLRELPLLTMFLRGKGGPRSNSQETSVSSSSLVALLHSSESVPVVGAGHCVLASLSSVAEESCHSAISSMDEGLSQEVVRDDDMLPRDVKCAKDAADVARGKPTCNCGDDNC